MAMGMLAKSLLDNGWRIVSSVSPKSAVAQCLEKSFKFRSFNDAFSFMTSVAMLAEQYDHHPDWTNYYNSVLVRWSTHCLSGEVTDIDLEMAQRTDDVYSKYQ